LVNNFAYWAYKLYLTIPFKGKLMPIYPHPLGNHQNKFAKPTLIIGNKNYSSWSLRAWLILHAFGIDFEELPIKLFDPSNQTILQTYTPLGKVPVLLHGDNTIWDSLAIALYAEKYLIQQNIWGNNPAVAMSLIAEMHSGFNALRNEMPMNIKATRQITPSGSCLEDIARFEALVKQAFHNNTTHSMQKYLLGEFSVVDVFFAPIILRLATYAKHSGVQLNSITKSYITAMLAHPSMITWREQALLETDIVLEDEAGEPIPN
jgi:glutathione S-transferase